MLSLFNKNLSENSNRLGYLYESDPKEEMSKLKIKNLINF